MRKYVIGVILSAVVLGVGACQQAYGAAEKRSERLGSAFPMWFDNGFYVGPSTRNPNNDKKNGIRATYVGRLEYDFPSIPATGAGSACQDSAAGTATGCTFGDQLLLGIDQVPPANVNGAMPTAYISAANTFKVRVCNDSTDAGAVDWPDASYIVRCISSIANQ